HSQIHDDRREGETSYCETLEQNSHDGEAPHNAEQKPSQLPAQRHQGEGSIGSGDQKIDCRMINDLQNVTRAGANERVIQSRADINQHQCTAKNRATGNLPSRPPTVVTTSTTVPAKASPAPMPCVTEFAMMSSSLCSLTIGR